MLKQKFLPLQYYSLQILELLQQSISHTNPAEFLYKKKTRKPLFMAESLTRLLVRLFNDKEMVSGLKKIKRLEDSLGRIEDFDDLYLLFSKNKKIKKEHWEYFLIKREKEIQKLNEKLIAKDFYQGIFNELSHKMQINFNYRPLIIKLQEEIGSELKRCFSFYLKYPDKFTDMGSQVHEMRRKLRWVSIHSQSLNGIIVLHPVKTRYEWEKTFIMREELSSPYNKLPVKKDLEHYIHFNKKAFMALSYVIRALGYIKDKGLHMEEFGKALRKSSDISKIRSKIGTIKQLSLNYTEEDLFKEAHSLLHDFFITYKIHELLILKS